MSTALYQRSRQLLRQEQLSDEQIANLLAPVGFSNWRGAYQILQRLAQESSRAKDALDEGLPQLLMALADGASPNRNLVNFERFVQRSETPATLLEELAVNPRGYEILVTIFTGSQFLTEILLRHPHYFHELTDPKRLGETKSRTQLVDEAVTLIDTFLRPGRELPDATPVLEALRRYQRSELLRIGASDLLGLLDVPTVTLQLAHLADAMAEAGLRLAAHQCDIDPAGFAVLGMGKLGGRELNYSSDIDLIFLADDAPNRFWKMGQLLIDALAKNTDEGFLYRVDMRLRPWGRSGALVSSVEGHIQYLQKNANLWERQALLKARTIAGDKAVGQEFLTLAQPIIFDHAGVSLRDEIHSLKQRIEQQLRKKGRGWGEVKLGQGSIRDIEFVTQYLQLAHGPDNGLDTPTTLTALTALKDGGILPQAEYRVLTDGYIFLRTVEHHLQLMHYRQTHTLPKETEALNNLARRLGFGGKSAGERFIAQYQQHTAVIRAVYQRHLANQVQPASANNAPDVLPLLTRMHPSYVITFSEADITNHAALIETLDDDHLVRVETEQLDDEHWKLTVVGFDYLGVLSIICGLLVVYGLDIVDGHVFTYGPDPNQPPEKPKRRRWFSRRRSTPAPPPEEPRKIVDVFTVRPLQLLQEHGQITPKMEANLWDNYATDLTDLFQQLHQNEQRAAQGDLAKRVVAALPHSHETPNTFYPVDIDIDNETSERHTVLQINSLDTFGFLYEFTNALALNGINVRRMSVASAGNQVQDTLYVTDARKNKITLPKKQQELRVATVLIKHFTNLLPHSPNPELALLHFREFIGRLFTRPNWSEELTSLEQPEVLSTLARLLGVSDFLWNDFLRMQHTNLFPVVSDVEALTQPTPKADLLEALHIELQKVARGRPQREALNAFKDREMFRIDMRQINGHITEFGQFSAELTDLAEVIVEAAVWLAARELRGRYGIPQLEEGGECPLSVCALGKCGGRELGFASDIELMFIYGGNGRTTGPRVTTSTEFYIKLVREVNQIIQTRREGIFELDLRLRPYGDAGSLAVSLESFESYFGPDGDAWPYERQALVKLRPISGDIKFGQRLVDLRDEMIYSGEPFDVAAMRAMRERQLRHLVTAGTIHAKLSSGGLVDIEYLVQGLQISHGQHNARLRTPNTREAMQALVEANILPAEDHPPLLQAYNFLRNVINALRMVRGNAKDLTVPSPDDESFAFLARRLGYGDNSEQLQTDLQQHTTFVRELSERLLKP